MRTPDRKDGLYFIEESGSISRQRFDALTATPPVVPRLTEGYDVKRTKFYDVYGRFLWVEDIKYEYRLYSVGEEFDRDGSKYRVERQAIVENDERVNVSVIEEDIIITEPHL